MGIAAALARITKGQSWTMNIQFFRYPCYLRMANMDKNDCYIGGVPCHHQSEQGIVSIIEMELNESETNKKMESFCQQHLKKVQSQKRLRNLRYDPNFRLHFTCYYINSLNF